ncbi:CAF17-like 4Fe-4S cluster assembly/insertion protein YgfZ [Nitrococcus mobilis]|uniref:Glycine cleavage T protein (Aminomethyl transferase) n=1 Tax=Nitrococcus mobilis Nb-231 TaxID=314278 RepID=A4BRY0_9GAMM|nr:folate-binding protein YgfZ [Nitrococcus mobilis]EAR21459.1 Glycine cleavage T protein (aminomethyl transferase) [Nitrococcus mobilis Nb-231]
MPRLWNFLDLSTPERRANPALGQTPTEFSPNEPSECLCALSDWGVIHVHGADAAAFLHSQLSNDIQSLDTANARLAAYCNAKGRALALLRVLRTDAGLLLFTHKALTDSLIRRLRMFVLRSKVTLDDVSEAIGVIGLVGAAARPPLQRLMGSLPEQVGGVQNADEIRLIRLDCVPDRFALVVPGRLLPELWARLANTLPVVSSEAWRLLEIRAGIPTITPATQEAFVPQMLNLEPLQGISYSKGCYPGQEVIARMHYLGKLKRRMYRLHTQTATAPAPGEIVRAGTGGQEAGTVVTAAQATPESCELLAVLRIELAEQNSLLLNGAPLQPLELPYSFDT